MSKILKSVALITLVGLGVNLYNNLNITSPNLADKESKQIISNKTTQVEDKNSTLTDSNKMIKSNKDNNNAPKEDYNILVSSNEYNAVVSLDPSTKKINIEPIDDTSDNIASNNYINLSDEDIKYLTENADTILNDFEQGNLINKYSLVTKMLNDYDTDINTSDLINIALKYLK